MPNCTACDRLETWKPIPDQPDYEVSDHGRIRSWKSGSVRLMTLQYNHHRGGYPHVGTSQGTTHQYCVKVHVVVAQVFLGPRPEGLDIRHIDGDPTNAHITNLAYGTKLENEADKYIHGTRAMYKFTHCRHGHEYDEANTRWSKGMRFCRACQRDKYQANRLVNAQRARDYRERKRLELIS